MAKREQRRAERRKRKARAVEHREAIAARYEDRNREARERIKPLRADERPGIVTAGAVISAVVAASILIAYAAGATVNGTRPHPLQVVAPAILMSVMAVGMWRSRYWAVMGFQALLALLMLAAALGLVAANTLLQVAGNLVLIAIAGVLFYFMIRAMARIQMPQREPRE